MNKELLIIIPFLLVLIGCQNKHSTIEYVYNSERITAKITAKNVSKKYKSNNPKELQFNHSNKSTYVINLYENGLKESEGKIVDNKKEGIWKNYYSNGTPKNHITFKNGKINGRVFEVDSLGGVRFMGTQKMGKLDGYSTYFNEDGTIRKQGQYLDGKQTGDWLRSD